MKKLVLALIALCLWQIPALSQQLPRAFRTKLDRNYKSWELAPIDKEIQNYFRKNKIAGQGNLIAGDFDGNGKTDYAAYVVSGKEGRKVAYVVALLQEAKQIKLHVLDTIKGEDDNSLTRGTSISLVNKGATGYDHETEKNFRYRNDAIFFGYFEKGGSSYLYRNGRFIAVVTSD